MAHVKGHQLHSSSARAYSGAQSRIPSTLLTIFDILEQPSFVLTSASGVEMPTLVTFDYEVAAQ